MKKQAIYIAALLAVAPAWAINKCTVDGKIVYQDVSCPVDALQTRPNEPAPGTRATALNRAVMSPAEVSKALNAQIGPAIQKKAEADRQHAEKKVSVEAGRRQRCGNRFRDDPYVGQSASDFLQCTAFTETYGGGAINETETASGVSRQHVFPSYARIKYVYTRNGVVVAIQR